METTKNGTLNKALMVGTALVTLTAVNAIPAQAATGTGPMTAVILGPIVVSGTQPLHFGDITEAGAGTVTIDTAGTRGFTGGVNLLVGAAAEQAGVISVTGATGVNIVFSMAAASFTVSDGLANTMVVNGFNLQTAAGGSTQTFTIAASPATFPIGGVLNVGAGQATGTYTGAYTINANYQ